jgi:hypothetical protein
MSALAGAVATLHFDAVTVQGATFTVAWFLAFVFLLPSPPQQ